MKGLQRLIVTTAIIFSVPSAVGQSVGLGLLAGLNSSSVSTDAPEFADLTRRSGIVGGVYLSVGILDFVSVRPEVLYSQKGVTLNEGGFSFDLGVDYFEVPLLAKISAPSSVGTLRPHVLVGPALSFVSSCYAYDEEDDEEYDCEEIDILVESQDVAFLLGAGVDADLGPVVVSVGGRYTIGLQTVDADVDPIDVKNRVWALTASIGVNLFGP